jgi:hypothetical protein
MDGDRFIAVEGGIILSVEKGKESLSELRRCGDCFRGVKGGGGGGVILNAEKGKELLSELRRRGDRFRAVEGGSFLAQIRRRRNRFQN